MYVCWDIYAFEHTLVTYGHGAAEDSDNRHHSIWVCTHFFQTKFVPRAEDSQKKPKGPGFTLTCVYVLFCDGQGLSRELWDH